MSILPERTARSTAWCGSSAVLALVSSWKVTLSEDNVVDVTIKTNRPAGGGGGNGNVMVLGRDEQVPTGTPPNTVIVRKA